VAFAAAMGKGFDYYLWLNDDTTLYGDSLISLLKTAQITTLEKGVTPIVVGTTQASLNGVSTYGGLKRISRWRSMKFLLVPVAGIPQLCDTMNGNCVLISNKVATRLGNLDKSFVHSMGDIDYGLRARKAGIPIFVMPGHAGICMRNNLDNTDADTRLSRFARWKRLTCAKVLPFKSWFVLTRRHGGLLWPLHWVWPYLRVLIGV
jgi:GT2 family glycosyltransferase